MSIATHQNTKENIELIAAQRYLYSKAKKLRTGRILISLFLALIVAPATIILLPEFKIGVGVFSSIWVVAMFLINHFEGSTIKYAATIQEQFDTTVFAINWNKFLVGNRISIEIITNATRKYRGDRVKLQNWYGDLSEMPHNLGVLVSQRSNLVWDWRLRKYFAWTIIISLLLLIGGDTSIAYNIEISKQDFILGLFLPSISAIIIGIRETKEHFEIASGKEKLEGQLTDLLDLAVSQKQNIDNQDLRQIQDKIFELRKKAALIPDWWYNMLKGEFEKDMQSSIDVYKEKLKH
jgi:SMODS-associating 4TM effector domain